MVGEEGIVVMTGERWGSEAIFIRQCPSNVRPREVSIGPTAREFELEVMFPIGTSYF